MLPAIQNLIAQNLLAQAASEKPAGVARMQWANLPESWGVFVLIAILAAIVFGVFWLYRREMNTCPMHIKLLMGAIRLSVMLMLVAMLLKPSIFYQQVNEIKPNVNFVRDASLSFARGDTYRDATSAKRLASVTGMSADKIATGEVGRADMLNKLLANPKLIEEIRNKGTIQVIDFSDGTRPVAVVPAIVNSTNTPDEPESKDTKDSNDKSGDAANEVNRLIRESIPALEPKGLGTDIWQALRESIDDSSRLSAIVLISDGQHNGSEDPVEIAKRALSLDIPIFVVGVGDPNPPKNIAVNEIFVRDRAYPDEPFEIEAMLQVSSLGDADEVPDKVSIQLVELKIDSETGKPESERVIESRDLEVPESGGRIRVDFQQTLGEPGRYAYKLVADEIDGETITTDNERLSSELEVVDEKVRVLLIAGEPSWDYQHVRILLERDSNISVSCWLQSMDDTRPQEGNEQIQRLPRTIEELGKYNVVLMMDPNPNEFDADWVDMLKTFCRNKAGGVFYMAGPKFTSEFLTLNRLGGVRDILPVRFGNTDFIATNQALATANNDKPGRLLLVSHNMDHPVLSFHSDPDENLRRWQQMPGIYWNFPVVSGKPTARILMERGQQRGAEDNQPLMVSGRFGAGTVLYMGFQGTFRWRPAGIQAQFFDRFWVQVVRYLVENRSLQGSRRGFIESDKSEYELGDRISLLSRLLDSQYRPLNTPTVEALVRSDDGRRQKIELQRLPGDQGRYEGLMVASRTGNYEATIELAGDDAEEKLLDPIPFRIVTPKVESNAFWLNQKLLSEIATQSGGKYFRLDELDQLPAALPSLVTRAEFNSPPEPLWDWNKYLRFFAFLIPVVLLSIEWTLRKWYKLL